MSPSYFWVGVVQDAKWGRLLISWRLVRFLIWICEFELHSLNWINLTATKHRTHAPPTYIHIYIRYMHMYVRTYIETPTFNIWALNGTAKITHDRVGLSHIDQNLLMWLYYASVIALCFWKHTIPLVETSVVEGRPWSIWPSATASENSYIQRLQQMAL